MLRTNGLAIRLHLSVISLVVCIAASNARAQQVVGTVTDLTGTAQIALDAAQKAASDAINLARATGMKPEIIAAMEGRLELYQKHEAWRE